MSTNSGLLSVRKRSTLHIECVEPIRCCVDLSLMGFAGSKFGKHSRLCEFISSRMPITRVDPGTCMEKKNVFHS